MDGPAGDFFHDDGAGPYTYCPRCGGALEKRVVFSHDPPRLVCSVCKFVFYLDPKVAVGAICRKDGKIVLLRRAIEPAFGKWVFPGGYVDRGESLEDAARREAREEIGLQAGQVEVIGRLPEYLTRTGYRVTPVVGLLTPPLDLAPDPREVEEVFEVPLAFLLDPRNHQRRTREFQGRTVSFYAIPYGERDIWGVTAGILVNFYRRLAD